MESTAVHTLGMGDTFRRGPWGDVKTVVSANFSVDGSVCHMTYGDGSREVLAADLTVTRLSTAPKCGCGTRYDFCEGECDWPDWLDALWGRGF
jgi:hypothetical protein